MHRIEKAVIDCFSNQNQPVLSTSELVRTVFVQEMRLLDGLEEKLAKRERARLHRKLLYHLQKLVAANILEIVGIQGRGEKRFSLSSKESSIVRGNTQVVIRKQDVLETPIDKLDGLVGFMRESWLYKVDALALEAKSFNDLYELSEAVEDFSQITRDVIGVLNFDVLLGKGDTEEFIEVISRMQCSVSLVFDLEQLYDNKRLIRFCRSFALLRPQNASVVFSASAKALLQHQELLSKVIALFTKHSIKLNFKNNNVHNPPIVCGRAGAYSVSLKSWKSYLAAPKKGLVLGFASVIVDLKTGHAHKLGKEAARALFLVARKRYELTSLLSKKGIVCSYGLDMVRLWNYDVSSETLVQEIKSTYEVISQFSELQERIYRACGLPIHSHISLSSAFAKAASLSSRSYSKVRVSHMNRLQQEDYLSLLRIRESLCKYFLCDRVRIFRYGSDEALNIFRELSFLLNSFSLPFITYDFSELRGDIKLTEFLGDNQ